MARSFLSAGINLLSSKKEQSDDIDDEMSEFQDDEYIDHGARGILVFKAYSVRSCRHKILHLNLYKGYVSYV
jgi:hypothetical protein